MNRKIIIGGVIVSAVILLAGVGYLAWYMILSGPKILPRPDVITASDLKNVIEPFARAGYVKMTSQEISAFDRFFRENDDLDHEKMEISMLALNATVNNLPISSTQIQRAINLAENVLAKKPFRVLANYVNAFKTAAENMKLWYPNGISAQDWQLIAKVWNELMMSYERSNRGEERSKDVESARIIDVIMRRHD